MNSDTELKPCPFCGAIPQAHDADFVVNHTRNCYFTQSYAVEGWLVARRIKHWNTRIADIERENNQLRAELKQCAEALKAERDCSINQFVRVSTLEALSLPNVQAALKK